MVADIAPSRSVGTEGLKGIGCGLPLADGGARKEVSVAAMTRSLLVTSGSSSCLGRC